ncbi:hypothetical protein BDB00DRAFT_389560 [Zychaea mexicana]|uniref:uncharacterized protein n=1 Tax=Zychaea mexicana TaxID=64656 RepID=UPI0022FF026F|nr:uncharacterized protein BDB00DRAFT_389560 [Zychaea mexicana]KAI9498542.1 hypothetical protein BDB00DRAFT_389560 [Zychaea mexicana]
MVSLATAVVDKEQKNDDNIVGAVADGYFHILHLAPKCSIGTRRIPIGETPNKILYDKPSNCAFVVTTSLKHSAVKSSMRLIDLSSTGTQAKDKILLSSKDFGFSDEILCMTEWTVAHRERTYRYLCLGIGQKNVSTRSRIRKIGTERGVLMLYRLKSTDRSASSTENTPSPDLTSPTDGFNCYTLRAVWNQEHFPGGIFAICPHPAGLLFSAGPVLHLYQLDPRQGKLVEITRKALRFLITSIHVDGDTICVTCQNDSISFYTYNEEHRKLAFLKSLVDSLLCVMILMIALLNSGYCPYSPSTIQTSLSDPR